MFFILYKKGLRNIEYDERNYQTKRWKIKSINYFLPLFRTIAFLFYNLSVCYMRMTIDENNQ